MDGCITLMMKAESVLGGEVSMPEKKAACVVACGDGRAGPATTLGGAAGVWEPGSRSTGSASSASRGAFASRSLVRRNVIGAGAA